MLMVQPLVGFDIPPIDAKQSHTQSCSMWIPLKFASESNENVRAQQNSQRLELNRHWILASKAEESDGEHRYNALPARNMAASAVRCWSMPRGAESGSDSATTDNRRVHAFAAWLERFAVRFVGNRRLRG